MAYADINQREDTLISKMSCTYVVKNWLSPLWFLWMNYSSWIKSYALSALVSINLFLTVSSSLQNSIFYSNLAFLASLTWMTVAVAAPPWLIGVMSLIGVTSTFPLFPFPLSIGLGLF